MTSLTVPKPFDFLDISDEIFFASTSVSGFIFQFATINFAFELFIVKALYHFQNVWYNTPGMENKISWRALEYKRKEKTADWYWAVIIIAICIVVVAFIVHDGLFAIFIILATGALLAFSIREPQLVDINIDQRGFTVGNDTYPFATLHEFWVDISEKNNEKIILRSKRALLPLIIIPIEDMHHLDVRGFLLQYLPEKELHEPLSQKIMERLGF